ncbi:MAG: hypothetical protein ACK56N_08775, partial [Betaproteobacteria bacterium]
MSDVGSDARAGVMLTATLARNNIESRLSQQEVADPQDRSETATDRRTHAFMDTDADPEVQRRALRSRLLSARAELTPAD